MRKAETYASEKKRKRRPVATVGCFDGSSFEMDERDYLIVYPIYREYLKVFGEKVLKSLGYHVCPDGEKGIDDGIKCDPDDAPWDILEMFKCDEDGRIQKFSVPKEILSLPNSFIDLDALQELTIHNSRFEIPRWLEKLGLLRVLTIEYLDNVQRTCLPKGITNLTNLRSLKVRGGKRLLFPSTICNLLDLRRIEVSDHYPNGIEKCSSLENLILGWNVDSIPSTIGCLKNLKILGLGRTSLRSMPNEIGDLVALEELKLCASRIIFLPSSIGNLAKLKRLDLSDTPALGDLPDEIGNLTNLEWLDLSGSGFANRELNKDFKTALPSTITNLRNLRVLLLHDQDGLEALPDRVGDLANLEVLGLDGTGIASFPSSFGNLTSLKELDLQYSTPNLDALPVTVGNLTNLEVLLYRKPNLSTLPATIINLENLRVLHLHETFLWRSSSVTMLTKIVKHCSRLGCLGDVSNYTRNGESNILSDALMWNRVKTRMVSKGRDLSSHLALWPWILANANCAFAKYKNPKWCRGTCWCSSTQFSHSDAIFQLLLRYGAKVVGENGIRLESDIV